VGTILLFTSVAAFLVFLGGCAGYGMSRGCITSLRQCENAIRFWRTVAVGFAVCLAASLIILPLAILLDWVGLVRGPTLGVLMFSPLGEMLWADLFCAVAVAALVIWMRRWWREMSRQDPDTQAPGRLPRKRLVFWLSLGMAGLVCVSVLSCWIFFAVFGARSEMPLSLAEVQRIVTERKDAQFTVLRRPDGSKTLSIVLPETGRRFSRRRAVADEATLKLLDENGVAYRTAYVSVGRPIGREGVWPLYFLLPVFVASMGAVMLLGQTRKRPWGTIASETTDFMEQPKSKQGRLLLEIRTDPMTRRIFGIAFGVVFLLVFSANGYKAVGEVANALGAMEFAVDVYVALFVGLAKGAFLGLIAAVGVLYLRARRKVLKVAVGQ
jgi:hypothetical protein